MYKSRRSNVLALASAALAVGAFSGTARAQTAGSRPQVQLAFGYECDDRFQVRNDGSQAVDVEYALRGAAERTALHLHPAESVAISSASREAMELWVGGKRVATEQKGNKACAANAEPDVVVRPLSTGGVNTGGDVVYVAAAPTRAVYVNDPYPYYGYDPYGFSFGLGVGYGYGFGYPYYGYRPVVRVSVPIYSSRGYNYGAPVHVRGGVSRGPVGRSVPVGRVTGGIGRSGGGRPMGGRTAGRR